MTDKLEKEVFQIRKSTWLGDYKIGPERLNRIISDIKIENYNVANWKSVYTIQALLYSIANLNNYGNCDGIIKKLNPSYLNKLFELLFYSDYHLRKNNKYYTEDYYFNDGNSANNTDRWEMFLLCGGFRLVCSYNFHSVLCDFPVLNDMWIKDYGFWLKKRVDTKHSLLIYYHTHQIFTTKRKKKQ